MTDKITRRDFVNGIALGTAGLSLSPIAAIAQGLLPSSILGSEYYPPALTGMRGSHAGSFEVAHALARTGQSYSPPAEQTGSTYDLIVVGGGISGLSAAKFFRDRRDGSSKILILDNHDDFGGHARRNEFDVDGETLLCYGGSQTIDKPAKYSKVAKQLLKDIAIDTQRFYDYYDQEYFSSRDLGYGMYFDRATYGVDRVTANPMGGFFGELPTADKRLAAIRAMPISEDDQVEFVRLLAGGVDYLGGKSVEEKRRILRNISYLDFLEQHAGMPGSVRGILQDTFLPLTSVGWEADSALTAAMWWFPGTWGLGVQKQEGEEEPYIFHFPDGNAGVSRSLVRDLIPDAIPGSTMEDLVTARADYSLLDTRDSDVQIRLNSTAVDVTHTPDGKYVDVTYVNNDEAYRLRARHVVLACDNNIIPHICSELPEKQVEAIRYATKIPFVIGNIAIRNWRAFADAGYHSFYSPGDVYFKYLPLDFPVSMGAYHYSKGPDEPIVISAWYSPTTRGLPAKEQYRAGRRKLLEMTYDDFEQNIYSHLDGMLGPYGFDAEQEIAAITLNRWPHGYAYEFEGVGVPAEYDRHNGPHIAGRAQIGRISIANSDSEAYAYVDGAIDAADRAVNEQLN
ncbi:MAG: NAD(P)-binding protein [Woeseiaceae bacterium]